MLFLKVLRDFSSEASLLDMREALLARGDARFPAQLRLRLRTAHVAFPSCSWSIATVSSYG